MPPEPHNNPSGLSDKQLRAIIALTETTNVAEAARRARVGRRSIHEWIRTDERFNLEYRRTRRISLGQAHDYLQQKMGKSAEVLVGIIENDSEASNVRIQAIKILFDAVQRSHIFEQLEEDSHTSFSGLI